MRVRRWLVVLAVIVLVAAACGDDADDATTAPADGAEPTEELDRGADPYGGVPAPPVGDPDETTEGIDPGATALTVVETELGPVLGDGAGRALYIFTNDPPGASTCTGDCLALWPRFAPGELTAGDGVDAAALGSIEVDGVVQATIGDQPLYYFAGDSEPGDVEGHRVGGVWFVVRGDGSAVP